MSKCIISPSVLASDLSKLSEECQRMIDNGCDWLHMDVMDGNFVPNITMGAPILTWVKKNVPEIFMDCHMMVADPAKWVPEVAKAGGKSYTFHYEATSDPEGVISLIKQHDMLVGLAISPETPASVITEALGNAVDMLLVMTVRPGHGGQKFMPECLEKVKELRERFPGKNIQVDGGVGSGNACQCARAGSNVLVAGTAIFGAEDPKKTIQEMRSTVDQVIAEQKK
ncbi:ribulose-phosphate 3-epimerase [Kwoniella mangroviensis CBS 10435]|uniref:Ribulose-phosphate 3-epimerase n=1 Tax=Kwoniella mangroviensis CBS 10435 TaxID=1331196 RepID=A0A1B9IGY1_9TREE|nr:ribulose-phosphate 3-epimerase [Kwoniella mangroviensis CBS 8507]OCF54701.1 ribulose-phosphate 3-epimerase [Kwoniella mangroviensis CBS 10435]OCF63818.1 ribulose-phosphate 3-epimerase [Kwoniella mangroviensis CBS 8507]OCF78671.1 ribulose-phosphate 3-epimerase [Kwoniella mangroviensis CBS 8886]